MSDIEWPRGPGFERTPVHERVHTSKFEVTLSEAFAKLEKTLGGMGVDDYRWAFDAQQRKTDDRPYARASPDDPGFALWWTREGEQYAVAHDEFTDLRSNVREIGLYLEEKRKMENRNVQTGEDEFSNLRLPPADGAAETNGDAIALGAGRQRTDDRDPHEILEVAPNASVSAIKGSAERKIREFHSDTANGDADRDELQRVIEARDQLLAERDAA